MRRQHERFNSYFSVTTTPNTRCFARGLGSCTLSIRPIPLKHRKPAWEDHETSDTSGLTRLRRTHTRGSTATFPLLQVDHESKHPVFCMWARLMYPADPPHAARAPENRVGGAGDLRYLRISSYSCTRSKAEKTLQTVTKYAILILFLFQWYHSV